MRKTPDAEEDGRALMRAVFHLRSHGSECGHDYPCDLEVLWERNNLAPLHSGTLGRHQQIEIGVFRVMEYREHHQDFHHHWCHLYHVDTSPGIGMDLELGNWKVEWEIVARHNTFLQWTMPPMQ